MICAPVPDPIFDRIDDVVIYLFAVEYVVKLLTCWAVSSRYENLILDVHGSCIFNVFLMLQLNFLLEGIWTS